MKIKLSDYVARFVAELGVKHVFMVAGGGAMHLNDSFAHHGALTFVSTQHEQASAMAAETYARISGNIGVAVVTTGPGGTNAITGVAGAWLDSTPCLVISGQVKRSDLVGNLGIRQNGVQEIGIVAIVQSITKYAVTVMEPESIRYHLERAVALAKSGRPGPVWIDIPLDVQAATIDTERLEGYTPPPAECKAAGLDLSRRAAEAIRLISESERPVLLVGNGVRLSGAKNVLAEVIEALNIPVLLTWPALDLLPDTHPLLVGRPGPVAPRGANFALQNSDCLLSVGARLDTVLTGYAPDRFARAAKKIMVEIDPAEIAKMKMKIDLPIAADAGSFLLELLSHRQDIPAHDRGAWLARCREWKTRYPLVQPEYRREKRVSTYVFAETLSEKLAEGDIVIPGSAGSGIEIFLLAFKAKAGQRVVNTTALGAMGNGLPSSIGGCLGAGGRRTVLVNGDGGLQLNIQELETISRLQLPIKIFVLDNNGYASIRTSQQRYFSRLSGADRTSGFSLPDIRRIAEAYGLPTREIADQSRLAEQVEEVLNTPGPVLCNVLTPPDEPRAPSMMSYQKPDGSMVSKPLEDLWPFLERDEFRANMLIPPVEE